MTPWKAVSPSWWILIGVNDDACLNSANPECRVLLGEERGADCAQSANRQVLNLSVTASTSMPLRSFGVSVLCSLDYFYFAVVSPFNVHGR